MRPFDIPIVAVFLVLVAFFVWHRLRALRSTPKSLGDDDIYSKENKE